MYLDPLSPTLPRMGHTATCLASGIAVAMLWLAPSIGHEALAVDWAKAKETQVTLFYPGQSSWEWVMTAKDHSGATKFREGKNCKGCHEGEQKDIGAKIVKGEKLEPNPPAGKPGALTLKVATAHDDERLYFRLRWTGTAGGAKPDPKVAARVTVMLDDGHIKEATRAGCWSSCHDDAAGMASAKGGNVTKYLSASRTKITRSGGGGVENAKPAAELAQMLKSGAVLEYWQARLNPGKPAEAIGGYILEKRHEVSGSGVTAEATQSGKEWTVILSRPLKATKPGQKDLVPGKTYAIGFAIHDNHANGRLHHVSLEQTLSLAKGTADFVAAKQ